MVPVTITITSKRQYLTYLILKTKWRYQHQKKKPDIITPDLAAALDRTGVSSMEAAFFLTAAAKSLGQNVEDINLSYKTIDNAINSEKHFQMM